MSWSDADRGFMAQAIDLATGRMGETWPNPAVGCVIVKDGRVIAQAATAPGGRPHAEEQAVPAAGPDVERATVYVTLEPCGARSSGRKSCAHFLTEARVARVVIACLDPSPFAAGRGTERLRAEGLTVETGLMCEEGAALCEGFLHRLETGRPLVRVSKDGAGFDGRFVASPKADLVTELKRLGEAGYTRLWTSSGELADALRDQGLLTE
ncbi:bifunctional diaminohydroxyphosphoribosylaminopyrimidine deaminase/5-amino-6-(5-phosphoribosylamino)uracil reductase RibD [Brevundimonas aurantiaca]|jgi:diaminohydroxyphosphoribosylaminopyrimidine deaminase/5-amino-6-(5-phosphoribosylamino)uracil reductase|uniref:Diaminohydroxyphosphoribosylaminopyrimidine deaminase/5-amino-6-(5-phosphoribosylamino)uracil reductase n=1 Tax=Brevundimonas aurantiaca TaxID=74316 RepID=A0A7W9C573_9CAUL|nr:bifunctional diaminohydroxyphosphoribosylaminopyrimidine deaminase/5-amino-6-(5-phosphoribosylamino)uracil reductase RibD [Brevundimonas aurantiaca]MBB5738993.1 diaminohydroxyphosphoribosylaminopyrimidine deaminase/5-amino-6-(5-phosphoribosylamino)uracil reductase [Brevundimonas aurantiaca]